MFVSTTLAVIFFTVFVQGITIRPLLFWLKVEKSPIELDVSGTVSGKLFERYNDFAMSGLEAIVGHLGSNTLRDAYERFNAAVLKPLLMRGVERKSFDASAILRAYRKITLHEAVKLAHSGNKIAKKTSRVRSHTTSLPPSTIMRSVSRVGDQKMNDIDQFLSNSENVELLYVMFSRMLDRKIDEMRKTREVSVDEDDIKDDYIGIIGGGTGQKQQVGNSSKTASMFRANPSKMLLRRESSLPISLRHRRTNYSTHQNGNTVNGQKANGTKANEEICTENAENGQIRRTRRRGSLPPSPRQRLYIRRRGSETPNLLAMRNNNNGEK